MRSGNQDRQAHVSVDEARALGRKVLAEAFHSAASTSAEEKTSDGREGWPSEECPRSGRGWEEGAASDGRTQDRSTSGAGSAAGGRKSFADNSRSDAAISRATKSIDG